MVGRGYPLAVWSLCSGQGPFWLARRLWPPSWEGARALKAGTPAGAMPIHAVFWELSILGGRMLKSIQ